MNKRSSKKYLHPTIVATIITAITSVCVTLISGFFLLQSNKTKNIALAETTALVEQIIESNNTQSALEKTLTAPTSTPKTVVEESVATSLPTSSLPTPTLSPTSSPNPPGFTFIDDFELGLSNQWIIIRGMPGMANGSLTVLEPFAKKQSSHVALISDINWTNVRIETTLSEFGARSYCSLFCSHSAAAGILIHYTPEKGGVGFVIFPNNFEMAFATVDRNFEWTVLPSTRATEELIKKALNRSFYNEFEKSYITIESQENTYIAYFNEKKITSTTISGLDNGAIGVWMLNSDDESDINSYAPRFENLTITSLP